MIVVSDTSLVSNLLNIGRESLLPQIFGQVLIPPSVERELLRFHRELPDFLKRVAPTDQVRLSRLRGELDPGEAEAICLACESKADRLLIDESLGRAVALREGVPIIGLVGVLVLAKQRGLLVSIAPLLQQLEQVAGFRLSQSVKESALRAVGEA